MFCEQRCGSPGLRTEAVAEFHDSRVNFVEPDSIGIVHRTATPRGKTVAIDIDDVDVARPLRNSLFHNAHALVDQRVDQSIHDLVIGNSTTLYTQCG